MKVRIKQGDCLELLKTMPADFCDSLVTDPPAGISFMGKGWDGDKGGRDQWVSWLTDVMREAYRVLKPGAHGLVWAIPRTSHWTATALENAGFEVRDVVTHLFGTGFPKSLDVSKAIDKAAGAKRTEIIGTKIGAVGTVGKTANQLMREGGKDNPSAKSCGKYAPGVKTIQGEIPITAPATDAARQWQGFGTALKPASEHWILVRKPLSEGTVAKNVLKHGTGAINVDGCRIGTGETLTSGRHLSGRTDPDQSFRYQSRSEFQQNAAGRFPANLVLSEGADTDLDAQAGDNVSRFFYCAKASKKDKGAENTHPTVKSSELMAYLVRLVTPPGGNVLDPFMGSGSTGVAAKREGMDFCGIEQDPEYFKIATARLNEDGAA